MTAEFFVGAPIVVRLPGIVQPELPATGNGYIYFDVTSGKLRASNNGNPYQDIALGSGSVVTLDEAYDGGGAGLGRTITVDAGSVQLNGNATDSNNVLEVNRNPGAADGGSGILVNMGANCTNSGLFVDQQGDGSGISVNKTFVTGGNNAIGVAANATIPTAPFTGRVNFQSQCMSIAGDSAGSGSGIAYQALVSSKDPGSMGGLVAYQLVGFAPNTYDLAFLATGQDCVMLAQTLPIFGPSTGVKFQIRAGDGAGGAGLVGGNVQLTAGLKSDATALDGQILCDSFSTVTLSQNAQTTGSPTVLDLTAAAHTGLANSELVDVNLNLGRTITLTGGGGAIAQQRSVVIEPPTIAAAAAQTVTAAATLAIEGPPVAGANVTLSETPAALWVQNGLARLDGSMSVGVSAQTADFAYDDTALLWSVEALAGVVTGTLPPAASARGRVYTTAKNDVSANVVTVAAAGGDTIGGLPSRSLVAQYDTLTVVSDGVATWFII